MVPVMAGCYLAGAVLGVVAKLMWWAGTTMGRRAAHVLSLVRSQGGPQVSIA